MIEVIAHDDPVAPSWTVASGFGAKAAWYRNLRATPTATIITGARRREVVAHFPTSEEGGRLMTQYAVRHPLVARKLSSFMGFEVTDGSAQEYRRVGESIPFVRFEPTDRD
ncbi:putative DUF385 family protein [Actinoalloteichus hymeniacidonis]|uniref:DUF385 family protein n=1 Tax=Actinoalloteichus hymeniacidonis TaxID=340345 RepID=A0AAC9HSG7_9PSEU|nr:putative DUF385 family protein [Actinoalloteichus hymeniacidonis]